MENLTDWKSETDKSGCCAPTGIISTFVASESVAAAKKKKKKRLKNKAGGNFESLS